MTCSRSKLINNTNMIQLKQTEVQISDLNDSIFRTLGAAGIFIKREVAKKEMRLRASKFAGTSIALSFTVSSKRKRSICYISPFK